MLPKLPFGWIPESRIRLRERNVCAMHPDVPSLWVD